MTTSGAYCWACPMPLTDIFGFRRQQLGRLHGGHHRPVYLAERLMTAAIIFVLLVPAAEGLQHEQHHPAGQQSEDEQTPDAGTVPGEAGGMGMGPGGGMGNMDEMMEQMGAPKPRELYPSLMSLPDLAPEERQELVRAEIDRFPSYGVHPTPVRMPVMEQLIAQGVTFDRVWAMPSCSPTRASLLTGRFPHRHGGLNQIGPGVGQGRSDSR